jgi:ribosomal protein S12 methylthiotransferase
LNRVGILHYFIDSHGCAKNQVDAETMMLALNQAGWSVCDEPDAADVIIVNSCGFIQSAKEESIDAVLSWRKQYPDKKLLLAGCLAQRYAKELAEDLPEADGLFGNTKLEDVVGAVEKLVPAKGRSGTNTRRRKARVMDFGARPLLSRPGTAYVKISEGCNNRCAFCAIPLIRGPLKSRSPEGIIRECKELLARGVRELNFVGQDLGSYGLDLGTDLCELLEELAKLKGAFWLRILYIHPDHFDLNILEICSNDKRILPYFDIPFQHGSGRILKLMGRKGTAEDYLKLIDTIRSRLEDAVIRTTYMVGFPTETQEDFDALLDFQKKAQIDWAGCFAYSREEGTSASAMPKQTPKRVVARRKTLVEAAQEEISVVRVKRFVKKSFPALIEECIDEDEGLYLGRIYSQAPEVDGITVITSDEALEPGQVLNVRITGTAGFDLQAVPVHEHV